MNTIFNVLGIKLTKKQKITLCFLLATTICFMWASYSVYYIKHIEVYMMIMSIIILMSLGRSMRDKKEVRKVKPLFASGFIIYFMITLLIHGEKPSVGVLCGLLMGYLVLSLKSTYKIWLYDRFITLIAILFGLSVIEFILATFCGISYINYTPIYRFDTDAHYFYQGIITLFPYTFQYGLARFQAFTEEPGLVGTLCAFLLACIDLKKNKWQAGVFIISGVLSMSLAFYLMFALWLIYMLSNKKYLKFNMILFSFLAGVFFYTQDLIFELVGGRFENVTSITDLDNRGTYTFKKEFDRYIRSGEAIFGRGLRTFHATFSDSTESGGNAGAKPFIYSYGLFSMLLLFFTYSTSFLKVNGFSKKSLFVLLLFWLSFYQREYWYTPYNIIPLFNFGLYDTYKANLTLSFKKV